MNKKIKMLLGAFSLAVLFQTCLAGTYTIVASKVLRPMTEYRVAVSRTTSGGGAVNLELEGHGFREAQLVTLDPHSTSVVSFQVGALNPSNYTLTARSVYGEEFFSRTPLRLENKTYCVFVHTDKTVYTAGDVIMFRLLLLNMHLKPMKNVRPQMTLKDGLGHTLKQWGNIQLTKGVFGDEVQLSEFPVLGDWSFVVEVNGQLYTETVLVADFVLPKFNLEIEAPPHIYYSDGTFPVSIKAEKFSGEEVEGELTLTVYPVFYSGVIQPVFQAPLRRVQIIKGRASFQLSLGAELQLRENEANVAMVGGRRLIVEAAVEEALTGRRQNVSALLWLHRARHRITHQVPRIYKPGLPFTVQIRVEDWESTGRRDMGSVTIRHGFPIELERGSEDMMEATIPVPPDGRVQHSFYPDNKNLDLPMKVEIIYNDMKEEINGIMPLQSTSGLLITLLTPNPTVGKEMSVRVNSTTPMNALNYYVLGRGDIIYAKTLQIIPTRKTEEIRLQATHAMAPEAIIMVSYVTETSELITSSLQFQVKGLFQNKLELRLSPEEPEPLGNVDFSVMAEPDSYVALTAGAASPRFSAGSVYHYHAGEGNGLSEELVLSEIRSFAATHDEMQHPFRDIEGALPTETIKRSGVVVLTDNLMLQDSRFDSKGKDTPLFEQSTRPPLAGPYAFSRLPAPPSPMVHLGSLPTNTWLFSNLTVGSEGRGILGRRLPASPGIQWGAGAWAVHPTKGLSIATTRAPTMRVRPSLRASAPHFLRENELLALPATLTNPTNTEINVEVTLNNLRQEFRFDDKSNEVDSPKALELYQRQKVKVPAGRSSTVVFFITVPHSAEGARTIKLQFAASGVGLADTHDVELPIIPNGVEETAEVLELLDMSSGSAEANLSLSLLQRARGRAPAVPADATFSALAWGWLLAPALQHLPHLASYLPSSGYHNMLPFMEATVLLQALDNSAQLSEAVRMTAVQQMQKVYQQQLAYLHPDGSFSVNKNQYREGSVWVTGFTAQWLGASMGTGRRDAGVPVELVRNALRWLAERQQPDGHWAEGSTQPNEHTLQQTPLVLTALTLQAFIDTKHLTLEEYSNLISKAQDWLARHLEEANSVGPGTLAPVAAALAAAHHPSAFQGINLLLQMSNLTNGIRWWKVDEEDADNPLRMQGQSGLGLWTQSWSAQALLRQGLRTEAMQAARTLLAGLRSPAASAPLYPALARLASLLPEGSASLEFRCPAGNDTTMLSVNKANYLLVQKQQVRERRCEVLAHGSGVVVGALQASRRTNVTAAWPRFTLDPRVDGISTSHHLQLTVCIGFVAKIGEEISGPVLMELRLPSGYTFDVDLPALLASGKVRSAKQEEVLKLVLAPLGPRETCMTLGAPRTHAVAAEHPGVITLKDLDDNSRRARVFFLTGNGKELCDVCWGNRCRGTCKPLGKRDPLAPGGQVAEKGKDGEASSASLAPSAFISLIVAFILSMRLFI